MAIVAEQVKKQLNIKQYKVQYPILAYTFPREPRIHEVRFDDKCMYVKLLDERVISVPLWWIPTLYNAMPEEREKYEINQSRTMIIWDPDKSTINDEVSIADYICPCNQRSNNVRN
ncbi:DUF2442 domain-containing protein [bacterium]|nr:DUF2442 domain-containing protein [bacterium]MBU1753008.1 DUF2442 domain-containing protein [bacterium]